jgi:hypothetical protein
MGKEKGKKGRKVEKRPAYFFYRLSRLAFSCPLSLITGTAFATTPSWKWILSKAISYQAKFQPPAPPR